MFQKRPLFLIDFDERESRFRRDDGHRNGRQAAAGAEVEDVALRLEDLRRGDGLGDVGVEVLPRLRPDEIDARVPFQELAPVDLECRGGHASEG